MTYTLRVSVLDACQLRCAYCLPKSADFLHKKSWLTQEQYKKIATALKPFALKKIRFTGGEPLLRQDLPDIIHIFSQAFLEAQIALTTNGQHFLPIQQELKAAGLQSITFHLDTLKEERYKKIMGNGNVQTIYDSLAAARKLNFTIKINMVVQKGINDDEIIDFLYFSQQKAIEVRFIELMNTGSAQNYVKKTFMSGQDILQRISQFTKVTARKRSDPAAPAESFFANDLGLQFGLIASDTRPFCHNCNRLRLSADGRLRTCLYEPQGHSLGLKENNLSTNDLLTIIEQIVAQKTSFHPGLKKNLQDFSMSQVGG